MSDGGSFKIKGADVLKQILAQFPPAVEKRAVNTGLGKAGGRLRTYFRRAAPRVDGTLRKSIGIKRDRKTGKVKVGLMTRFYYKVLSYGRKSYMRRASTRNGVQKPTKHKWSGSDMSNKFIEQTWYSKRAEIAQMIIDEARRAIEIEAGKMAARSRSVK
jgi:hypothetical protein